MTATRSASGPDRVPAHSTIWTTRKCVTYHAGVVVAVIGLYFLLGPSPFMVVSGLFVAPYFFYMLYVEAQRAPLKISPISVYFLWQAFALGVSAIYIGIQLMDGTSLNFGFHLLPPDFVAKGYLIGLIGTLPLHAGMQWVRPKPTAIQEPTAQMVRSLLPRVAMLYGFGLCILVFGQQLRFLGTLSSSFEFAAHAALVTFLLISPEKLGLPESNRLMVVIFGTAVLLLASTSSGAKLYLMLALVGVVVYVLQKPNLTRHLPTTGTLLILFYLTVVAPTVSKARDLQNRYQMDRVSAQIEAFKIASPLATGTIDTEFYKDQVETLFQRQFEAISIAFIAQEVQVKGHLNGEVFYRLPYALIPRILWPEKPWVVKGGWFTSYTGASPREGDSTFALGMEAAGEFYWNFGILGVLGGMLTLGMMLGGLWRLAGADPRNEPLRMSLYMYASLGMMNVPEAASRMVACLSLFLIYGTLFFLMRPHGRSKTVVFRRTELSGSN